MPIFRVDKDELAPITSTTFAQQNIKERADLQRLLKFRIDAISPDTLIVAEEFGEWEDSRRRIDLLGINKDANIVVIELKRTEDDKFMDLQAIRYAAMISKLTFDDLVETYEKYLAANDIEKDARRDLLDFLGWNELDEQEFGQEVKILLAAADFTKELTTSVMWLNEFDLDIRCVRMTPYEYDGQVLIDFLTVIPIPEAEDYQVSIRKKKQKERESRKFVRDYTKYNVSVAGTTHPNLNKRHTILELVRGIFENSQTPDIIKEIFPPVKLKTFSGELNADQVKRELQQSRYFCNDEDIFHTKTETYVLTNQWGGDMREIAEKLAKAFPDLSISCEEIK